DVPAVGEQEQHACVCPYSLVPVYERVVHHYGVHQSRGFRGNVGVEVFSAEGHRGSGRSGLQGPAIPHTSSTAVVLELRLVHHFGRQGHGQGASDLNQLAFHGYILSTYGLQVKLKNRERRVISCCRSWSGARRPDLGPDSGTPRQ